MADTPQILFDYDDYTALRDEILARPLNDIVNELAMLRDGARSAIMGNNAASIHTFEGWAERWKP